MLDHRKSTTHRGGLSLSRGSRGKDSVLLGRIYPPMVECKGCYLTDSNDPDSDDVPFAYGIVYDVFPKWIDGTQEVVAIVIVDGTLQVCKLASLYDVKAKYTVSMDEE